MILYHAIIKGAAATKKNHQRILHKTVNGKKVPFVMPSKQYKDYEALAGYQLHRIKEPIKEPCNVECRYYFEDHRRVDLVNLLEATLDILTKYGIIADDNSKIVYSMDGSRVILGAAEDFAEIVIREETI